MLWFAFILWTTDIYTNTIPCSLVRFTVVICFHSLNYWYLHQLFNSFNLSAIRCDLLSFFELLIFTPTRRWTGAKARRLWFAFILWTTDIYTNVLFTGRSLSAVVICFHSLNYWYLHQQHRNNTRVMESCDLLSFFELLIFTPTIPRHQAAGELLWFAFILWTTDIYTNAER